MARSSDEIAEVVLASLLEIHGGSCSITQKRIEDELEHDRSLSEILSGLVLLAEDLQFREVERQRVESELIQQNQELTRSRAAYAALAEELSTPIIKVWKKVLMLPIVGSVDAARASDITERLLDAIVREAAEYVILDLTGVTTVDSGTASYFYRLSASIEALGAKSIIGGVQPSVAVAMVTLGIDTFRMDTTQNAEEALMYCIQRMNGTAATG